MISGVLWANNGCSSLEELQVRIKTGDPKIESPVMLYDEVVSYPLCLFFMDNHDRCTGSCGCHKKDQQKQVRIVSGIGAL